MLIILLCVWGGLAGAAHAAPDAFATMRTAAEAGEAEAQYMLARMYERGDGIAPNDFEAVRWLERAAAQDHKDAMMDLGWMLANGYGTPKDPERAYTWFTRAAAFDVAGAADQRDALGRTLSGDRRNALTEIALQGLSVAPPAMPSSPLPPVTLGPEDSFSALRPKLAGETSIEAFQKLGLLAEKGDLRARNLYGLALRRSTDVQDRQRGRYWLLLAAQAGLPAAQYNFAGVLMEDGTPPDFAAVARWLDLAQQGSQPVDPSDYNAIAREFAARSSILDPYRAALEGSQGAFPELRQLIVMRRQEMIAHREMVRSQRSGDVQGTAQDGITTTVIE